MNATLKEAQRAKPSPGAAPETPAVVVASRKGPSIVWVVPLVAALIGGWLVYKTLSEKGPTITISFNNADGLEAGKTKIKYKSVEVGQVDAVAISEDLSGVVATISLDKETERHLQEGTQFWVVRPRLGMDGVSGLGTLISGAYIAIDPGHGAPKRAFTGLESPPIVRADTPGQQYVLRTDELGSAHPGAPIYFRQIQVGEVMGFELAANDQSVLVHIFVDAPHHTLVQEDSRFWNASGIDVSMGANGLQIQTQSVTSLLSGGIAFDNPTGESSPAPVGTEFHLYKSPTDIRPTYTERIDYVLFFTESVRGLIPGAPVEFRGVQVGEVTDVRIEFDDASEDIVIPVSIAIEPERIPAATHLTNAESNEIVAHLVDRGMRAQLQTGSLITGQKYIAFDMHPDKPVALAATESAYPQLPTIESTFEGIADSASGLLAKLQKLPLEQLLVEVTRTVEGVNSVVRDPAIVGTVRNADSVLAQIKTLTRDVGGQVTPLLAAFQGTATTASKTLIKAREAMSAMEEGAPMRVDLLNTLEEASAAARSIRILSDYLERHPDALLHGKGTGGS